MKRVLDLIRRRLISTGLAVPGDSSPAAAVRRLGCAQGQDLPGVIASLALRSGGSAQDVMDAMTRGEIVRSYPMRGTVFAVHAHDIAWMGEIIRPKYAAELTRRRANHGVPPETTQRVLDVTLDVLDASPRTPGGSPDPNQGLLRSELAQRWSDAGIDLADFNTYHFVSTMMMEGHVVYGPWDDQARDQRVVAASSWLPENSSVAARFNGDRTAAISEWLRRYLVSHGPASLRDFAWWTKLSLAEIKAAAPSATEGLDETEVDQEPAWHAPGLFTDDALTAANRALLLPGFDELVLGYRDRSFLLTDAEHDAAVPGNNGMFRGIALDRAKPLGTWRRGGSGKSRKLEITPFDDTKAISKRAIKDFQAAFTAHPWIAP